MRSATMMMVNISIRTLESAKQFLWNIGDLECIQFIDLQQNVSILNKPYSRELIRIKEALSKITAMEQIMGIDDTADLQLPYESLNIEGLENTIQNAYDSLQKLKFDEKSVKQQMMNENHTAESLSSAMSQFISSESSKCSYSDFNGYFVGFATDSQRTSLETQLHRTSSGNSKVIFHEDGHFFIVFYSESTDCKMGQKLKKHCDLNGVHICFDSMTLEKKSKDQMLWDSIHRSESLEAQYLEIGRTLKETAGRYSEDINEWKCKLQRVYAVKSELNKCIINEDGVGMSGWCLEAQRDVVHRCFTDIVSDEDGQISFTAVIKGGSTGDSGGRDSECIVL